MKFETKFKPNDYCYPIFLIGTEYKAFSSPICIDYIRITETQVFYISKWNEEFNEKDCFDTKEKAQDECNIRNKKKEKNIDPKYCILEINNPKVALCVCKHKPCHFPQNFEELKDWCKNVKDVVVDKDLIFLEREDLGTIEFYNDGAIVCNEYFLAENRTAAQMWNFILSLTEKNNVIDRKR